MRSAVAGLETSQPLHRQLPGLYAGDEFAGRFLAGLDMVLAPVFATLDCLPAYFDPRLVPADFLDWLGGWLAADIEPDWPVPRRREAVGRAVELHRWRGTRRGLAAQIRLVCGVEPEIEESGGASWSAAPGSPLPGSAEPALTVRLRVPDPQAVAVARVRTVVEANRPAHVPCRIEVVQG
jgi:phage tail-like protein